MILCLVSCKSAPAPSPGGGGSGEGGSDEGGSGELLNFSGISFTGGTYTYDGTAKTIEINGSLPEGASVSYSSNSATNAGVYNASATLTCEGYNTKTLTAVLTINKASYDMTGAKWSYSSPYTYDGSSKSVTVTGLPQGVSVKDYTNNTKTGAGNYTASVSFNYDKTNYNAPTLPSCSWKINKADITESITLSSDTVEYDSFAHSIQIVGNLPYGVNVKYTYNGIETDSVTDVGAYDVVATLTSANYNTLTLTAKLTIKSTEKQLYMVNHGGVIYFQNALDADKLYKLTAAGEIKKVNNDKPEHFFTDGQDLYYYSSSLFSKTIKKINSAGLVSIVYSVKGDYLTCDGEYIYWAVNNLVLDTDKNGIYRYSILGDDAEPTRICTDKAAYLCISDGYLYYSNLSDGKKLCKISVSGGSSTLIHDEAVEYIIECDGVLYFNSKNVASAIYKYHTDENTAIKMTTDSGKYLCCAGNDVYYVNNDLLTSTLFGDGIYKVSVLSSGSMPGNKLLSEDNNGYSSLTTDGEYLYYYKLNDKHLYSYEISSGEETDLMEDFVPPVEEITPAGDTTLAVYNGEIYYTNPKDGVLYGAALYKYNPTTRLHTKVLSEDVAGIWFNGNYMYYSTCVLTNYALFRMNMTSGETEKISSARYENLIFDGDYIYCIKVNAIGNNAIMRFDTRDISAEPTVIYNSKNVSVTGIWKDGDSFYFVDNPAIGWQTLYTFTLGGGGESLGVRGSHVILHGERLYYFDGDNLKSCALDGSDVTTIASSVEINEIYASGTKIYYSSTKSGAKGLYTYDTETGSTEKISDKVAEAITEFGNGIWFINTAVTYSVDYPSHSSDGDLGLYFYNGSTITAK